MPEQGGNSSRRVQRRYDHYTRIITLPPPLSPLFFSPRNVTVRACFCAAAYSRIQEPRRNTDDHRHNGHLARVGRARQLLVIALRIDSTLAMGEEPRIIRALVPSITHTVQYTVPKCYMGQCIPRRTVIDPKKKKKKKANSKTNPYLRWLYPQFEK